MSNPFCGSKAPIKAREFKTTEYVHYYEKETIKDGFDPKEPDKFLIEKTATPYEIIPIKEYINSFASKVGLKNELRGIVSKQQMDDYIQTHKAAPGFTDLTKLPDTQFEMEQLISRIDSIWNDIPVDLRGSLSKEEFLKTMTSEKLKNYVISQLPKKETEKPAESE